MNKQQFLDYHKQIIDKLELLEALGSYDLVHNLLLDASYDKTEGICPMNTQ